MNKSPKILFHYLQMSLTGVRVMATCCTVFRRYSTQAITQQLYMCTRRVICAKVSFISAHVSLARATCAMWL